MKIDMSTVAKRREFDFDPSYVQSAMRQGLMNFEESLYTLDMACVRIRILEQALAHCNHYALGVIAETSEAMKRLNMGVKDGYR